MIFKAFITSLAVAGAIHPADAAVIPFVMEVDICPKSDGALDYEIDRFRTEASGTKFNHDIFFKDRGSAGFGTLFGGDAVVFKFERFHMGGAVTRLGLRIFRVRDIADVPHDQLGLPLGPKEAPQVASLMPELKRVFEERFPCQ